MAARSSSMQYSAEAAGSAGQLHCHVIRRPFGHDGRAHYSITVGNETNEEANVFAFAAGPLDPDRHTVVRTTIGARSEFSTSAAFELPRTGSSPELYVVLSSGDIDFTLVVPGLAELERDERPKLAHAVNAVRSNNGSHAHTILPAIRETYTALASPPASNGTTEFYSPAVRQAEPAPRLVPEMPPPPASTSPSIAPVVGFFSLVMLGVAFAIFRPQVQEFALPSSAPPGSPVIVRYGATGLGDAAYTVLGPAGTAIAHGALALGNGTFSFTAPVARGPSAYLVRVSMTSPLGSAIAEDYLHVTAGEPPVRHVARHTQPVEPPQIRSLALDRSSIPSGQTLGVYYDAAATDGTIALTDPAAQITYGRAAFGPSGRASFIAPYVDAPRLLSVIVTAQRGGATTQSRIIVTVVPPTTATPLPADVNGPQRVGMANVPTTLTAPSTVFSQEPVRVDVHGSAPGLAVLMLDATGAEIDRREVAAGATSVEFNAPAVRVPTRFLFTATYPRGQGSEMIVRNIMVLP